VKALIAAEFTSMLAFEAAVTWMTPLIKKALIKTNLTTEEKEVYYQKGRGKIKRKIDSRALLLVDKLRTSLQDKLNPEQRSDDDDNNNDDDDDDDDDEETDKASGGEDDDDASEDDKASGGEDEDDWNNDSSDGDSEYGLDNASEARRRKKRNGACIW
jgi:hypothetical protein